MAEEKETANLGLPRDGKNRISPSRSETFYFILFRKEQSIIKNIEAYLQKDTETLLANCLRYPLLGDYTAYSSKKMGMEIILRTCNGLEEFMKRSDKEAAAFAININDIDFSGLSKFRKSIAEQFLQDLRLYLQGKLE